MNKSTCKMTNLVQKNVPHSLNKVVGLLRARGRAVASLPHGGEEGVVQGEQLVQTGEEALLGLGVQLHLLAHAPPEHLRHDVQRLQVVDLRLHQL